MARTVQETKQELSELFQQFHRERFVSDTPPDGITPGEARTLMVIDACAVEGESVRPGHVAERLRATPSALSQTLRALEEKDLIERHRSQGDFRAITLELTARGRTVTDAARAMRDKHMDEALAFLGPEDAAHLVRILKKMLVFHEQAPCSSIVHATNDTNHEGDASCE